MMNEIAPYEARTPIRRKVLAIRGIDYSICEWGDEDAPLLIYLHGWADTGSTFQFVIDELKEDWHVVAPDWRGFGRTTHAAEGYWFPDYIADLHELLEHFSPDAAVSIVGHSMGGNIASLYAGAMPERVNAFVNVEGFGLSNSSPSDAPGRYRQWLESGQKRPVFMHYSSYAGLAVRVAKRSPSISPAMAEFVAREWGSEGDDGSVHLRADAAHKLPNPVLYRLAEAEACWQAISAPVLLVHGELSPFAEQAGGIAELAFPNSSSIEIPASGHMLHFEAPQQLAAAIEGFLRKTL
jgi:pimeloyl-ACP methyl ester carboxylesterase